MKIIFRNTLALMVFLCCIGLYNPANAQTDCYADGECTCTVTITVTSTGPWTATVARHGDGPCDNISGGPGVDVFTYTVAADPGGTIGYGVLFNSGKSITSVHISGCGIDDTQYSSLVNFTPVACETDCCDAPSNITISPSVTNPALLEVCADAYPTECGEASYYVRWREVGTTTWVDLGSFINQKCQFVGDFEPCTQYEFQMSAITDGCGEESDFSASVFYTTDCPEECCEAPSNITISPSVTNPALLEVCADAYPTECGEASYYVRWREVGTTTWMDLGSFINQKCQFVGDFEPCTQYEFQMSAITDGCGEESDFSTSVFYTTHCPATDCFADSECTCQITVTVTSINGSPWTGTIGRLGAGACDDISGPGGTSSTFVYNVDANAAGTITYGYFPGLPFVPVHITVTGCGLNLNFDMTTPGLFTFNPVASCLMGNTGGNRMDMDAEIAAIEAGAWGIVHSSVTITPNPANDWLEISTTGSTATYNELIDINGRVVNQILIESNGSAQVDVSQLATGIYILRTTNGQSGEVIASEKVVIKH